MIYDTALEAVADGTRRRLLARLRLRPHAVGELAVFLKISQPAVSQHLRVLRRARLVRKRAERQRRIFSLDPAGIAALRNYIDGMWNDALAAYGKSLEGEEK